MEINGSPIIRTISITAGQAFNFLDLRASAKNNLGAAALRKSKIYVIKTSYPINNRN
jgi:hypothetical protein